MLTPEEILSTCIQALRLLKNLQMRMKGQIACQGAETQIFAIFRQFPAMRRCQVSLPIDSYFYTFFFIKLVVLCYFVVCVCGKNDMNDIFLS